MKKRRQGIGLFILLIFLSTLLFLFNFLFLSAKVVENNFLEYEFYEDVFNQTNVTEIIINSVNKDIQESINESFEDINQGVSLEVNDTFKPLWIETTLLNMINDSLNSIKGGEKDFIIINLSNKKNDFESRLNQTINNVIESRIKNQFENVSNYSEEDMNQSIYNEIGKNNQSIKLDSIPENINISEYINDELTTIQKIYHFSSILPYLIFILFFISFIILSGIIRGSRWISLTIATSSSLFLVILFNINELVLKSIEESGSNIINQVLEIFIQRSKVLPFTLIIISLIVYIGSIFLEKA